MTPINNYLQDFCPGTVERIKRIGGHHGVSGILHIENDVVIMSTIQGTIAQDLVLKLPIMNSAARRAVTELDILNELVVYRIETKSLEIIVAPREEFTAVVILKVKKSKFKGKHRRNSTY